MGPGGGLRTGAEDLRCSGGRTRTLNNWTRTSRVADYTTPDRVDVQISRGPPPAFRSADHGSGTRKGALNQAIDGGMMRRRAYPALNP
jgi:hypothetical protein